MIDLALSKVLNRITGMALLHGKAYCEVTYDENKQEFNFNVILPQFVTIDYSKESNDV